MYLKEGKTQKMIAEAIGVSKSTISREVKRNSGIRGYTFKQAQEWADIRKERLRLPRKMNAEISQRIEKLMRTEDWSPEQIEGWCAVKGYRMVSKSSIYEYIHKDKVLGGDLYKHCRFHLKHRRKPVGKYIPIKNRVGIEKRPVEADGTRFGDWEMDLMVGAGGKGAMVTLVEKSTSFSMIRNLPLGKNAKGVASTVINMLLPFKKCGAVKTITTDNGPEFAEHETISKKLDTTVFSHTPTALGRKDILKTQTCCIEDMSLATTISASTLTKNYSKSNTNSTADPEKKSVSNCRSKNFIYICMSSCILVWNLSFFIVKCKGTQKQKIFSIFANLWGVNCVQKSWVKLKT